MSRDASANGDAALIETLTRRLLGSPSATAVLELWCRERAMAPDAVLRADPVASEPRPPTPEQCLRLAVTGTGAVRYRRVRLTYGGLVMSEAENWYVPGRLTPEMNHVLETTAVPFGRVVHSLAPSRRNLSLDILWRAQERRPDPATPLFALRAVLSTRGGVPFCEVIETYRGAVLGPAD